MTNEILVPIYTVAYLVGYFKKLGISGDRILENSGIDIKDTKKTKKILSLSQEQTVLNNVIRLNNNKFIGLDIGLSVNVSAVGILGYAMLTAPCLHDSLSVMIRFSNLLGTNFTLSLVDNGEELRLETSNFRAPVNLQRFLTEIFLVLLNQL